MTPPIHRSLSDSVQFIKGVGPKRAELLHRMGLHTAEDCLAFFPFRYEDRTHVKTIAELKAGDFATFCGRVADAGVVRMGRRRKLFEVVVQDATGQIRAKWFRFREPYMKERYAAGRWLVLSGKITPNRYLGTGLEILHPDAEVFEEETEQLEAMGRIVPVYPSTEGLHQKSLRQIMQNLADMYFPLIEEFLPEAVLTAQRLPGRREAFRQTHLPPNTQDPKQLEQFRAPGQVRLIFEELFLLQLALAYKRRHGAETERGTPLKTRGPLIQRFVRHLPFELTVAQKRVLGQIMDDLEKNRPMNRLLHGDVGSGKTIVALTTLLTAVDNGHQGALMAPTELLAEQHYLNLLPLCRALGVRLELATSALTPAKKQTLYQNIASGVTQIAVGTHALIQKEITFYSLGVVVIDEQHRFGVRQREALGKKGPFPHVLVMTATPIPRSLAMTLYGDMDVSQLDEMPPGRQPITTRKFYENRRDEAYARLSREIQKGRQGYVVCPLVEESETVDLKTVTEVYDGLHRRFPEWRLGLIHGRLKQEERQRIMAQFKEGNLQALVATTIIEVGIDVPNATTILIEHAERFGLAQLHQLRGRVGRGAGSSECLLVAYHPLTPEAKARLEALVQSQDGFVIAEEDLKIRGPGDFMGTRQAGLPLLKMANLVRDFTFIEAARQEAFDLIARDPHLSHPEHQPLKAALQHYVGDRADLASIL